MQSVCDAFGNEDVFISNLIYPEEHGLIKNTILYYLSGRQINTPELRINENGIIHDDGGLKAILGGMTIRLHDETLCELERIINSSTSDTTENKKITLSASNASCRLHKTVDDSITWSGA